MQPIHKWKINLLCSLGYLYFLLIPVLILALIGGIITAMVLLDIHSGVGSLARLVVFPLGLVVWLMFKGFFSAVFTKLPEPEGVDLTPENAPKLHATVQDILKKLDCPTVHSVKLYPDSNAFIAEQPTFGLLGRYRRHLMIGVPLLTFLTEEELASVIAHECGHIAGAHGREGIRIYRARTIWERVVEELRKKGKDRYFFIGRFLYWYVPALNDAFYRLSRQFELAADRSAAAVAGSGAAAASLVKIQYWCALMEREFWRGIAERNRTEPKPPDNLFDRMRMFTREGFDLERAQKLIDKIRSIRSLPDSTHPAPIERIEAMGAGLPEAQDICVGSGSVPYDGLSRGATSQCALLWKNFIAPHWEEVYKHWQTMAERLAELNNKQIEGSPTLDEQIERAALLEQLEGADRGLSEFSGLHEVNPSHASPMYNKGRLLLAKGDEEGVGLLEQAMEADAQHIPECCYELMNHYLAKGDSGKAVEAYQTAVGFMVTDEDVEKERNNLRYSTELLPHELPYDTLMRIKEKLAAYPGITKAYVAKVGLQYSGQYPCYIVLYKHKYSKRKALKLQDELTKAELMPWECFVCNLNTIPQFAYKVDNVPDSRIL